MSKEALGIDKPVLVKASKRSRNLQCKDSFKSISFSLARANSSVESASAMRMASWATEEKNSFANVTA
jgi:hypothetical protein